MISPFKLKPFRALTIALFLIVSMSNMLCRAFLVHSPQKRGFRAPKRRLMSHFLPIENAMDMLNDSNKKVKFVDASWYHKGEANQGRTQFERGPCIPGSVYFDLIDISASNRKAFSMKADDDEEESLPQPLSATMPSPQQFGHAMDMLQIQREDHVVVYGTNPKAVFVPRVWFMFYVMKHPNLSILNGTLEDWIRKGGPVDEEPKDTVWLEEYLTETKVDPNTAVSRYFSDVSELPPFPSPLVANRDHVLVNNNNSNNVVVDSRGSSFATNGHIPGAHHVPYSSLMATPTDVGYFRPTSELQNLFQTTAGVDPLDETRTIVCSCGSGVSACSLYLALMECGRLPDTTKMYDGSWQEWKQLTDTQSYPKVLPPQTNKK